MPTTKKQQAYLHANDMGDVAKKLKKHKKSTGKYKDGFLGSKAEGGQGIY